VERRRVLDGDDRVKSGQDEAPRDLRSREETNAHSFLDAKDLEVRKVAENRRLLRGGPGELDFLIDQSIFSGRARREKKGSEREEKEERSRPEALARMHVRLRREFRAEGRSPDPPRPA
jgi:hypothetical protein